MQHLVHEKNYAIQEGVDDDRMPGESKHVLQSNQVSGYRANTVGSRSKFFLHLSYPETRDSHWVLQLSKTNNALAQGEKNLHKHNSF